MTKSNYEVEVLINGKPAKEYIHDGKVYVEGRKETKFSLRLRNNTWQRKLFVPTIDGLSVLDGKDASFDSSGYIVPSYSSITVDGWRTSNSEVAEFYFSSPKDSYGKRSGKGNNLGVIGCAVFDENIRQAAPVDFSFFHSNSSGGSSLLRGFHSDPNVTLCCASAAPSNELGTGWGESKRSEVISVEFDREPHGPSAVFEIFYNTREQLEALGISLTKAPAYVSSAFPGEYCKPPAKRY
jgi:hypothetical protein